MKLNQVGVTLLELLIVVAIVGILASIAAPSVKRWVDEGRLTGAAEDLSGMLYYARSESLARNADVYVDIDGQGTTSWCVGVSTGNYCSCSTGVPACELSTLGGAASASSKSLDGSIFQVVTLTAPTQQWVIETPRGLVTAPSTLTLSHPDVGEVKLEVNKLGRLKVCSDAMSLYSDC